MVHSYIVDKDLRVQVNFSARFNLTEVDQHLLLQGLYGLTLVCLFGQT